MRRTDFKRFLSSYQAALGASIPASELPFDNKCFDLQYVLEHRDQNSEKPDDTIVPGTDTAASHVSSSLHDHVSALCRPVLYAALAHCDREPRGHKYERTPEKVLPSMEPAPFKWARPFGEVENKIRALLPQLENWLNGTLPSSMPGDSHSDDSGILLPTVDIDIPLAPIRDMLYEGV
ncbi:uncharacterized protein KD926_008585 [Aspergillus affinis]|uniref:uncharacterized protein n=1 Tax=Aspergillus affinis TaxID=1070780 RepID=UPI0022FDCB06|nr:uncharacterized protein KD926_008585 [Aspergillus affinis]KAI9040141.1 hypothetical protein KD926_008585 [Aspergillus affinis]